MYLKQNKFGNRTHLVIAHGYREKGTKKVKTKTIQSLGYLDVLEKEYADPIAHFKQVVKEMNDKEKTDNPPGIITFNKQTVLTETSGNRKNLGYAALSKIYHELDLYDFFYNRPVLKLPLIWSFRTGRITHIKKFRSTSTIL